MCVKFTCIQRHPVTFNCLLKLSDSDIIAFFEILTPSTRDNSNQTWLSCPKRLFLVRLIFQPLETWIGLSQTKHRRFIYSSQGHLSFPGKFWTHSHSNSFAPGSCPARPPVFILPILSAWFNKSKTRIEFANKLCLDVILAVCLCLEEVTVSNPFKKPSGPAAWHDSTLVFLASFPPILSLHLLLSPLLPPSWGLLGACSLPVLGYWLETGLQLTC